jgi:SM-20-related protein
MKSEDNFEIIIEQIIENGFGILDNFILEEEIKLLNDSFSEHYNKNKFKEAGISKDGSIIKNIRGDKILWLEKETANAVEWAFLEKLESFIQYLNRTCFLGLKNYEIHYASYPIGTFYKRHLDKFRSDSGRKLSFICYINPNWQADNGGELVLFLKEGEKKVLPLGGRLVCFESDKIEHEVLPANQERRSITGWLKTE